MERNFSRSLYVQRQPHTFLQFFSRTHRWNTALEYRDGILRWYSTNLKLWSFSNKSRWFEIMIFIYFHLMGVMFVRWPYSGAMQESRETGRFVFTPARVTFNAGVYPQKLYDFPNSPYSTKSYNYVLQLERSRPSVGGYTKKPRNCRPPTCSSILITSVKILHEDCLFSLLTHTYSCKKLQ